MPQPAPLSAVFALETQLGASWPHIHACHELTLDILKRLEASVTAESRVDAAIVVFGSVARFETTEGSDIDWSYVVDGQADAKHQEASVRISKAIDAAGLKIPAAKGSLESSSSATILCNTSEAKRTRTRI